MKTLLILISLIYSLGAMACDDKTELTLENDQKVVLCRFNDQQVDQKCSEQKENCAILKFLKATPKSKEIIEAQKISEMGRPGSRICNLLKLKVLMGTMKDGSQICLCQDNKMNLITCNVAQSHFE